jgi:superfamily II DNA/RNA helicase
MISHLNTVVFDEVDMLLTSHFRDTSSLIRRLRLAEHRPRFVFAAATLPARGLKSVRKYLEDRFPDAELVTTGGMHSYRLAVAQEFRELPDDSLQTRLNALRSLLQEIKRVPEQPHVLVFVNSVDSAKRALEWLQGESIEAVGFHRDVPEVERAAVLERARSAERPLCIIATDMASRGLDLPLVGHVVQLEFAENVVDHIHRVGRTGRAALGGVAIGFYSRAQLPLIDAIRAGGVYAPDSTFSRKRQFRKRLRRVAEAMSRGEIEPQAVSF